MISNSVLSISQVLVHVRRWSGEVNTVSAGVTLNVLNTHSSLSSICVSELTHSSELPGVLTAVDESDIVATDVKATIELVSLLRAVLDLSAKDSLAVVRPEVQVKGLGTHGLLDVRCLEEAKLVAVLPGPLTPGIVNVNSCVLQVRSSVLAIGNSIMDSQVCDSLYKSILTSSSRNQSLTHRDPASILHAHDRDVTEVEPEVPLVNRNINLEQIRNLLRTFLCFELLRDDIDRLFDSVGALGTGLICAHENVQIK